MLTIVIVLFLFPKPNYNMPITLLETLFLYSHGSAEYSEHSFKKTITTYK